MTVTALLTELRRRDIRVWVDGDQLRCNAPAGVLTPDLRDVLCQRKCEVIDFLRSAESFARQQPAIVPLQPRGTRAPIFGVPGHNGDVFLYRPLVQQLGNDQPFFGLEPPGVQSGSEPLTSVHELAAHFARQIREFRATGPYALAGYCAGATVAYEIAQQLLRDGGEVTFVAMFAGAYPTSYHRLPQLHERWALRLRRGRRHLRIVASQSLQKTRTYVADRFRNIAEVRDATTESILQMRSRLMRITAAAVASYEPQPLRARVCLVFPSRGCVPARSMTRWRHITPVEEYYGPNGCEGDVMLLEPHVGAMAELVRQCRDRQNSVQCN